MPRILNILCGARSTAELRQALALGRRLHANRFQSHVVCLAEREFAAADDCDDGNPSEITRVSRAGGAIAALRRLRRAAREFAPDLIHAWGERALAWAAAANESRGALPLVGTLHRAARFPQAGEAWRTWFAAPRARAVICPSAAVARALVGNGWPPERVAVIAPGVEPADDVAVSRAAALADLGLPPDAKLIVAAARLTPTRRIKEMIWAADLLKVVLDDTHLLVCGDGPQHARLLRYRRQVRIDDRVHLVPRRPLTDILPHAHLYWQATDDAAVSPALLEALGTGTPMVLTESPATRELLTMARCGYLIPIGDRAGRAQRTLRVLEDAELADRLRAHALSAAAAFDPLRWANAYAGLYTECLARPACS